MWEVPPSDPPLWLEQWVEKPPVALMFNLQFYLHDWYDVTSKGDTISKLSHGTLFFLAS